MNCQAAFDQQVRPKLEMTFGKAVAMLIVASASNSCGVIIGDLACEEYRKLCEAIARDQRVVDMWGPLGAKDALMQWTSVAS